MNHITLRTCKLLVFLLFFSGAEVLWGQARETRLDRTFDTNNNTRLSIENRFGKVHIDTWTQNKIKALVVVEVEGNSSDARDVFDRINIDVSASSGEVRIETDITESNKWRNQRFKINYNITMPKSNPLIVEHRHGDLFINNFDGPLEVDMAHGQMVAEELNGACKISLQHGNGGRIAAVGSGSLEIQHYQHLRLGRIGDVDLEIAHASVDIDETGDMDLEVRHSSLELGTTGELELDMQHSKLEAENVESFRSDMQHSTVQIERLGRVLNADCNHSNVEVDRMSANFQEIIFDGNHSYLEVELESGASSTIDISLNHGKFHYPESAFSMSHVNIENNSREYRGKLGNGSGGVIEVDGNFTDFSLGID